MIKVFRNKEILFVWTNIFFVFSSLLISCTDNNIISNNDNIEDLDLISFTLSKNNNSFLENDIHFTTDTVENTIFFKAYYLKWIDHVPENFRPTFIYRGKKIYLNGKEALSDNIEISLTDDVRCDVYNSKGDKKTYIIRFICPQINAELPVLRFGVDCKKIQSKEIYTSTSIDIFSQKNPEFNCHYEEGKIRGRGNSTWLLPKKPYRIKFPEKVSPLGLTHTKAKDWVILGHDMDKSLLRNHLGFKISEVMFDKEDDFHSPNTVCFTPCSQFVNVYFGDSYYGIYQFTDQKEKGKGRIDIETLGVKEGDDPDILRGGHFLESVFLVNDPSVNFTTSHRIRIDHKYPKDDDHTESQYKYIEDFINTAESALYNKGFDDPETGWRKYFDEHSLANFIIVKEVAGDMDGYTSTQMYKLRSDDRIFFGPAWDMDKSWGNDIRIPFSDYNPKASLMIYGGFRMPGTSDDWLVHFWQDVAFRKLVKDRWLKKRDDIVDVFLKEIEERPFQMGRSIEANFHVWQFQYQECSDAPAPAQDYSQEVERVKKMFLGRVELLNTLFE